jgi:hypothetical protein
VGSALKHAGMRCGSSASIGASVDRILKELADGLTDRQTTRSVRGPQQSTRQAAESHSGATRAPPGARATALDKLAEHDGDRFLHSAVRMLIDSFIGGR